VPIGPAYYQQNLGKADIGAASVTADGQAHYQYAMGEVSLAYSSDGGWRLAGGSVIERSTRKGVPKYTADDLFELDGEELVFLHGSPSLGAQYYKTKRDNGCQIIYYYPEAYYSYWLVKRPDGSLAWYGRRSNDSTDPGKSKMIAYKGKFEGKIRGWNIAEEQSRGRYDIKYYNYQHYALDGHCVLYDIYSNKKGSEGQTRTSIRYDYLPRYKKTNYAAASSIAIQHYPSAVYNAIRNQGAWQRINAFSIQYDREFDFGWRVKQIIPFGSDDSALNPTIFEYHAMNARFDDNKTWALKGDDFNFYVYDGNTNLTGWLDMNGDGLIDRMIRPYSNPHFLTIFFNNGNGFNQPVAWNYPNSHQKIKYEHVTAKPIGWRAKCVIDLMDMNNDGKPDRITPLGSGQPGEQLGVWLNTGSGFLSKPSFELPTDALEDRETITYHRVGWTKLCLDVNGDGFPDLLEYDKNNTGKFSVRYHTGAENGIPFSDPVPFDSGGFRYLGYEDYPLLTEYQFMDMNGDGLPDMVRVDEKKQLWVAYNHGYGLNPPVPGPIFSGRLEFPHSVNRDVAGFIDLNSDGLPDRANKFWADALYALLNTGCGLNFKPAPDYLGLGVDGRWRLYDPDYLSEATSGFLDMNGDGFLDRVTKNSKSPENEPFCRVYQNRWDQSGKLQSVLNAKGGKTSFTYKAMDRKLNPSCYPPKWCVATMTEEDGLGNSYATTYEFEGGVYDLKEREFRGFGRTMKSMPTGEREYTYYLTDPVYKGLIKKKELFVISGTYHCLVNAVTYNYSYINPYIGNNEVKQIRLDAEVHQYGEGLFEYRTKTQYTYDYETRGKYQLVKKSTMTAFGQVDLSNAGADIGDDKSETITTYINNPSNWLLGLTDECRLYGFTGTGNTPLLRRATKNYYSNDGDIKEIRQWDGSGWVAPVKYDYDAYGNVIRITDPLGNATTTIYESYFNRFPVKTINALGHEGRFVYDALMRRIKVIDINGVEQNIEYDPFGRIIRKWILNGSEEEMEYKSALMEQGVLKTPECTVVKIKGNTDAEDLISYTYVDGFGRTIQEKKKVEPDIWNFYNWATVNWTYGLNGNKAFSEMYQAYLTDRPDYSGFTGCPPGQLKSLIETWQEKGNGAVRKVTDPAGKSTTTMTRQWTTTTIDQNGNTGKAFQDGMGRVIKVIEPNNAETLYSYLSGTKDLVKITDARGNATEIEYDLLGRKIQMKDSDMGLISYRYDADGNLIEQRNALHKISFQYDALNRNTKIIYPGAGNYDDFYFDRFEGVPTSYAKGRLARVRLFRDDVDLMYQEDFKYDAEGRVIENERWIEDPENSAKMRYEYDKRGLPVKTIYPDREEVVSSYDAGGRLNGLSGMEPYIKKYFPYKGIEYYPFGKIKRIDYGNGDKTEYAYDDTLRIKTINTTSGIAYLINSEYTYDPAGNVISIIDHTAPDLVQIFNYDNLNRLILASGGYYGSKAYQYDAVGNMVANGSAYYAYDDPKHVHAVTRAWETVYEYDTVGNLIKKTKPNAFEWFYYDWNNRLIQAETAKGILIARYDHSGRRIKAYVNGVSTYYFFPGYETSYDSSGRLLETVKYYFAGSLRVSKRTNNDYPVYFHQDHLGSTNIVVGNELGEIAYEPYGKVAAETGPKEKYKFNDKELDSVSGLYCYGSRYYDPNLCRFITADSFTPGGGADPQGLNRYAYCLNNPVKYTDPSGNEPEETHWIYSTFPTYKNSVFNWETKRMETQKINLGYLWMHDPQSLYALRLYSAVMTGGVSGLPFWSALLLEGGIMGGTRALQDLHLRGTVDEETVKTAIIESGMYVTTAAISYGIFNTGAKIFDLRFKPPANVVDEIKSSGIIGKVGMYPNEVEYMRILGSYKMKDTQTFETAVLSVENINQSIALCQTGKFLKYIENTAKTMGAQKIELKWLMVENTGYLSPKFWSRYGYQVVNIEKPAHKIYPNILLKKYL
jgi:RHS repeat-associated protein